MPSTSYERAKSNAIEQRIYGDSYRAIGSYLENTEITSEEHRQIIAQIKTMEENKTLKKKPPGSSTYFKFQHGFIAALVITLGILMFIMLWDRGWVSTLPLFIIGFGLLKLFGNPNN